MLSAKPWKPDAIVRLMASVLICMTGGSLLASTWRFLANSGKPDWKLGLLTLAAFGFLFTTLVLLRKPWSLDNFVRQVANLLVCFYAGFLLTAWAEHIVGPPPLVASIRQILIGVLSFQGAGLVLTRYFLREHRVSWREAFGLGNHWRYALLLGLMIACLYLPFAEGLQRAMLVLMEHLPHWPFKPEEQQAVQVLRTAVSWGERIALGSITILLAPVAEEILFRGILYPWVKQLGFPRLALWGTALLFAAVHVNFVIFLPLFALAVALTLLYETTNNLLAPIAAHSLFNALNFVKLYLAEGKTFIYITVAMIVIVTVALVLLLSGIRRDEAKP